jgi:rod shape determining protein RodA
MTVVAITDMRVWQQLAYPFYLASLVMLVLVDAFGIIGMGAQRWLKPPSPGATVRADENCDCDDLGALFRTAKHDRGLADSSADYPHCPNLGAHPADRGTARFGGCPDADGRCRGDVDGDRVRWWKFGVVLAGVAAALPIAWFSLHDYQKKRLTTFLDPEADPLGAGYHITPNPKSPWAVAVSWARGWGRAVKAISISCPKSIPILFSQWWVRKWG